MTDISSQWLIQQIQHSTQGSTQNNNLWCCDENVLHQIPSAQLWQNKPHMISNRWDIAEQATHLGFSCDFNDFDLSDTTDGSVDRFFYRISKEKAVVHHLINEAFRVLKPQGVLFLSGQKNEGIKTYIEKASSVFGCEKNIQKNGSNYSSKLYKKISQLSPANPPLDDDDYNHLRACITYNEQLIYSKPGQFGWDKIDQGSAFLMAEVSHLCKSQTTRHEHCLDLGCGYGLLSIASQYLPIKNHVLTDNNAAALISAQHNCLQLGITAEIIASDAGSSISRTFDLILCNPPFHQGFNVDEDLTAKFLASSKRLLAAEGVAYFVVNQFIPLEKKAQEYFKLIRIIAKNNLFKIVELRHH